MICGKYTERPLIGRVTEANNGEIVIDWMIGSYSGVWREWKGREGRCSETYTEKIPYSDIVLKNVQSRWDSHLQCKTCSNVPMELLICMTLLWKDIWIWHCFETLYDMAFHDNIFMGVLMRLSLLLGVMDKHVVWNRRNRWKKELRKHGMKNVEKP